MTQKKPIIGITPSHNTENNDTSLRPTYPKAIAAAGGLPILLPLECSDEDIKQFMDVCDGFLFTGGPDINPFLFGEENVEIYLLPETTWNFAFFRLLWTPESRSLASAEVFRY